ncbi:hypothetical protein CCP3SC1AL1_10040 [Gammaproteobacteria bacterium]
MKFPRSHVFVSCTKDSVSVYVLVGAATEGGHPDDFISKLDMGVIHTLRMSEWQCH